MYGVAGWRGLLSSLALSLSRAWESSRMEAARESDLEVFTAGGVFGSDGTAAFVSCRIGATPRLPLVRGSLCPRVVFAADT